MAGDPRWLVIGYGNTLRSDDGAGVRAAEALAALGINARFLHQLAPEHAEWLAEVDRVIFVDARLDESAMDPVITPVEPSPSSRLADGHVGDPRTLLTLSRLVHGRAPRAWLVAIPAIDFAIGEELSPVAARGVELAVERIIDMIGGNGLEE